MERVIVSFIYIHWTNKDPSVRERGRSNRLGGLMKMLRDILGFATEYERGENI